MKNTIWLAGLMVVTLAGLSVAVNADDSQPPAGDNDKPAMGQGMDPEGGMMGAGPMGRMKEKLGLSDDQAAKLKSLFKSQREANKPLRDQMKIDMDTLQQKVDTKASDADIKKLLDKLDSEQKQLRSSRDKMKDQLRSILTPTQQAKMVLGMNKMGMGMMQRWKGHHGGKMKDAPKGGDGNN